ncbi:MAG: endonuclease/exonuclease/phosphatase family protein [Acidimicrobiales bacterium]
MDPPTLADREVWARQLGNEDLHLRLLEDLPCLHQVDQRHAGSGESLSGWVRVAAWNLQRGRRPVELAERLRSCGARVCLLSEVDVGMARTQNKDVADAVATDTGSGYAFGVEFVELGLGDELEQREAAGADNEWGLHGNAIVSVARLEKPCVVRLPDVDLGWFGSDSPQARVGGRMAVLATVALDSVPVVVASTHLENRSDPAHRAEQMEVLLQAVDERAGGGPAIVGGDFNTLGTTYEELFDRALVRKMRAAEPTRFSWPVAHEPLFDVARAHGFEWTDANVAAPTTEHDGGGLPDHVPFKLDWFLVRGLIARRPAVVPAGGLSDHHLLTVGVRVP